MNKETREAFVLMAQEQEEDRHFHNRLVAEAAKHPQLAMEENLKAVTRQIRDERRKAAQ